jgi:hypothetical protein
MVSVPVEVNGFIIGISMQCAIIVVPSILATLFQRFTMVSISTTTRNLLLLSLSMSVAQVCCFVPHPAISSNQRTAPTSLELLSPESWTSEAIISTSHSLSLLLKETDPDNAKGQFFFFFGAGSGAGGIGLAQIPRIIKELQLIRSLSNEGPTQGGETLSTNPLVSLLYPKPVSLKDVQKVISKIPPAATINARGSSTSFFATKGYVVQEEFLLAMASCNPLASYAAFQAISKGGGKCVAPDDVDKSVSVYKAEKNLQQFAKDFETSAYTKVSAYAALAFLLFVTFDLIIETGLTAFL